MKNLSNFFYIFSLIIISPFLLITKPVKAEVVQCNPVNEFPCTRCTWDQGQGENGRCIESASTCLQSGYLPNLNFCSSLNMLQCTQTGANISNCTEADTPTDVPTSQCYECVDTVTGCVPHPTENSSCEYDTYASCNSACKGTTTTKYSCQSNGCTEDQNGTYTNIGDCAMACTCNGPSTREFHPLRPYPGSACGDSSKALFCSNDLIFTESFDISKFPSCISQAPDTDGAFTCTPSKGDGKVDTHNLIADLYDSEFPILGNTEDVINSISNLDTFDDPTKVNEYVSWYLNGVTNKAEYGKTKNTEENIVNYSGPLRKLLPSVIQDAQRVSIVDSGVSKTENNNQIVVCAGEFGVPIVGDAFGIGPTTPVECYANGGTKAQKDIYRLSTWDEKLSLWNDFVNDVLGKIVEILPSIPESIIKESLLNHWNSRKPPLPWEDDPFASPTRPMTNIEYRKYYSEWRGKTCVVIPVLNTLICLDNVFVPNKYAQLFEYVPLAKNVDKLGEEFAKSIEYVATSGTIDSQSPKETTNIKPASLFFAHTQESKDLIGLLNKVFTPMTCTNTGGGLSCGPLVNVPAPASTEQIECSTVNVRTNPGDQLFPNGPNQFKIPNVTYQITSVPCEVTNKIISYGGCNYWEDPNICSGQPLNTCCDPVIEKIVTCNAEVAITVKTESTTPYADEVFQEAVAGTGSTFRKIFPKVEPGAPIECIADIPSVSAVTIDGSNSEKPNGGTLNFDVNNPTTGSIGSPQLTFPHIGSVYEYFLKGIQTALRPKGYGEPIVSGALCSNTTPQNSGNCVFDMNEIDAGMQAAASKYNIPVALLKAIFEIESFPWIIDPSSYVCKEFGGAHGSTSVGIAAVINGTYDWVTCSNERMEDVGMCGDYGEKLSRCNIADSFELMARVLLANVGKYQACTGQLGNLDMSYGGDWYISACRYYGLLENIGIPDNIMPEDKKRPGGMLYCDFVGWKLGKFPPYPPKPTSL